MIFALCLFLLILTATITSFLPFLSNRKKLLKKKLNCVFLITFFSITSLVLYSSIGSYTLMTIKETLQNPTSTKNAIETALESWIKLSPNNEQALFLLGNHYMNENAPKKASTYFFSLYKLNKQSQITAQLAQSLFLSENAMTAQVQTLIQEALAQDENNTTALGLQGIYFFEQRNYHEATLSWQKALSLEKNIYARDSLEIGIQKAKQMIDNQNN